MPTTYPRIQVTITPDVAAALAAAEQQWPQAARSELVTNLIGLARHSLGVEQAKKQADRRQAITETAGILTGAYPDNYLDDLRADWPA